MLKICRKSNLKYSGDELLRFRLRLRNLRKIEKKIKLKILCEKRKKKKGGKNHERRS